MASFIVRQNKLYSVAIELDPSQRHLPNSAIADKIHGFGFTDVSVSGSGRKRFAQGTWLQDDATKLS